MKERAANNKILLPLFRKFIYKLVIDLNVLLFYILTIYMK